MTEAQTARPRYWQSMRQKDPRILLLYQQNKFAGAARNHGMRVARGKYISFLDSDDLFAPEMLERMVEAAEKWQADIVHCQACEYYPETGKLGSWITC